MNPSSGWSQKYRKKGGISIFLCFLKVRRIELHCVDGFYKETAHNTEGKFGSILKSSARCLFIIFGVSAC